MHRGERSPHVRRHVVGAFVAMTKQRIAIRHEPREEPIQVAAHVRVGVSCIRRLADVCRTKTISRPVATPASATNSLTGRVTSSRPRPLVSKVIDVVSWRNIRPA